MLLWFGDGHKLQAMNSGTLLKWLITLCEAVQISCMDSPQYALIFFFNSSKSFILTVGLFCIGVKFSQTRAPTYGAVLPPSRACVIEAHLGMQRLAVIMFLIHSG